MPASLSHSSEPLRLPDATEVYAHYESVAATAQEHFRGSMQGRLVLIEDLTLAGAAATLAASIAGAASLVLDDDGERIKAAMRLGICEFAVTHLDEALRILKNEVRKKQPVAVAVAGDTAAIIREMQERGVQPDVLLFVRSSAQTFTARGSALLSSAASAYPVSVQWSSSGGAGPLTAMESLVLGCLDDGGGERLRWLSRSPRYLGRKWSSRRYLRMSEAEYACVSARIEEARTAGTSLADLSFLRV